MSNQLIILAFAIGGLGLVLLAFIANELTKITDGSTKQVGHLAQANFWLEVVIEQQKIMNNEGRERHQELKRILRELPD